MTKTQDPYQVDLEHGYTRHAPLEFVPYWKLTITHLGAVYVQRMFDHEPTQEEVQAAVTNVIYNLRRDLMPSGHMPLEFECTVTRHMTIRETA